jgi:hypothetical protein
MKILTKKEQKAILIRIAANHIMAKKIIDKLHEVDRIDSDAYCDYVEHLISNTADAANLVAGMSGMIAVKCFIDSKEQQL